MTISAFPTPTPSRGQTQDVFDPAMAAFLAQFPTFVTEANALATAMNLNETTDASVSSLAIGTGSKTFTVSADKSFQPGMYLVAADTAAPSTNSMLVQVTSYAGTTLVTDCKTFRGSGTIAAWVISQSAAAADLASDIHAATAKTTPVTADEFGIWDSVSLALRKVTWGNIVTTLQTAFASLTFSVGTATAAGHAVPLAQFETITSPTLTLSGSTGNPTTPVTSVATYVVSGKYATVNVGFANVDTTGASGSLRITGLPNAAVGSITVGSIIASGFGATPFTCFVDIGSTNIQIVDLYGAHVSMLVGAGKYLYATLRYRITS